MRNAGRTDQRFFELQSHRYYNLLIFATAFVIFLGVPPFILDPQEANKILNNGMTEQVFSVIVLFIAVFCALAATIYWVLSLIKLKSVAAFIVTYAFCWVALSGFLFPLTQANGTFAVADGPTRHLNVIMVFALSTVLTILWLSKHSKMVCASISVFILAAVLPTLPRMFSEFADNSALSDIQFSSEKNIIVIGFDGVPGHKVKSVFEKYPEMKETFRDFELYENAIATSPSTGVSLTGLMFGNNDFTQIDRRAFVETQYLYFNDPDKYNVVTNSFYNNFNANGTKFSPAPFGAVSQFKQLFVLYKNIGARLTTKNGIRNIDKLEKRIFGNLLWGFDESLLTYDSIVNKMMVGGERPVILYLHFGFTHFPISFDQNCVSKISDSEWINRNQNEAGLDKVSVCAVIKYSQLIEKLKKIGVYKNSLIILNSDHGFPSIYYDNAPGNLLINGHNVWGFDRYRPLLMIKDSDVNKPALTYNQNIVLLDDIAQTTCFAMEPSSACNDKPGVNLLDSADIPPQEYFIHVAEDETSTWSVKTHKAVKLPRNTKLLEAMRESIEVTLTDPNDDKSAIGPRE
jgi:hypothetical protein